MNSKISASNYSTSNQPRLIAGAFAMNQLRKITFEDMVFFLKNGEINMSIKDYIKLLIIKASQIEDGHERNAALMTCQGLVNIGETHKYNPERVYDHLREVIWKTPDNYLPSEVKNQLIEFKNQLLLNSPDSL